MRLACKLKITFYDASYVTTSYELNAALITDDKKLRRKIYENRDIILKILSREITLYSTEEIIKGR